MVYFETEDGRVHKHQLTPAIDRPGRWRRKVDELAKAIEKQQQ
jgi:hypothetical protein